MNIVKEWLKEFVPIPTDIADEEIARKLSMSTVEVEGVRSEGGGDSLRGIVIGRIKEINPHPNADRLRIVLVDIGEKDPCSIVCGGSNLAMDMRVAVALPGASVRWHGEGEPIVLARTTIRGVESSGMICASSELGLGARFPASTDHEILDLSSFEAPNGTPLEKLFSKDDTVFEIDNKSLSHRPDLWGHRGIAREIAALFHLPFGDPALPKIKKGVGAVHTVTVENADLCPRYMGVVVAGVSATPSPEWMQERLRLAGLRPINALVDVTNYVMLEYGQPMHAFDYDVLNTKDGVHISVRNAKKGEKIKALDGETYQCNQDALVIADEHKPLAIAGVIGGVESAVTDTTHTIILEAATFHGPSIRRTSGAVRIATDSSRRFEKQLDSELPPIALSRAVALLSAIFPDARVVSAVADKRVKPPAVKQLIVTADAIKRILGVSVELSRVADILTRLGFTIIKSADRMTVRIPSFRRKDIVLVEDVCEEILRFVGYDSIPSALPCLPIRKPIIDRQRSLTRKIKQIFADQYGFYEAHRYAFSRGETLSACGFDSAEHFELANPISDERPYLCRSLIPNLLEAVVHNQQKEKTIALFEIARVFLKGAMLHDQSGEKMRDIPEQPPFFSCVYSSKNKGNHFAFVRDAITQMCAGLGIQLEIKKADGAHALYVKGRAVDFYCGQTHVGTLGIVSLKTRLALGIDESVVAGEIDVTLLARCQPTPLHYCAPSLFPAVLRDITFVVDESVAYKAIVDSMISTHSLIKSVEPFDVYRSEKLGQGKKSFSFHVVYQLSDRTLTSQEVDEVHALLSSALEKKWNAILR